MPPKGLHGKAKKKELEGHIIAANAVWLEAWPSLDIPTYQPSPVVSSEAVTYPSKACP
jgi:hypothetical protein